MEVKTISLTGSARMTAYIPDPAVGYRMSRRRPGILLAPGGAYLIHATREKEGVALEFLAKGYNVFILEYSIGFPSREAKEQGAAALGTSARYPAPVLEMMEAIHYVKAHCDELNLDASRLFMMGFSAGAHVCASCGLFWNRPAFTKQLRFIPQPEELKVAGMVLCYPMLNPTPEKVLEINDPVRADAALMKEFLFQTQTPSRQQMDAVDLTKQVTADAIPAFIWHSTDDPVVYAADSTRFVLAMQQNGVRCEYHLFEFGGHGLALANKVYAHSPDEIQPDIANWTAMADRWMENQRHS